jgi:hypothetical protein
MAAEARSLANANLNEPGGDVGEDHSAHATGRTCVKCDGTIHKWQPARRRGETGWVHDVCPLTS